jgi:hypothetical protein
MIAAILATRGIITQISATIDGTSSVTATLTGKGAVASTIHGSASVSATLRGIGAVVAAIAGHAVVSCTLLGNGALACEIEGVGTVTCTIGEEENISASIEGTSTVTCILGATINIAALIEGKSTVVVSAQALSTLLIQAANVVAQLYASTLQISLTPQNAPQLIPLQQSLAIMVTTMNAIAYETVPVGLTPYTQTQVVLTKALFAAKAAIPLAIGPVSLVAHPLSYFTLIQELELERSMLFIILRKLAQLNLPGLADNQSPN